MESAVPPSSSQPSCPSCGGTGFAMVEVRGQTVARVCTCRKASIGSRSGSQLFEAARIPRRYRECELEGFGDVGPDAFSLANAKVLSLRFVEEFPLAEQGLMFIGNHGTGKTHLAAAILRKVIAKGFSGVFYDTQDLLRQVQSTFDLDSGGRQDKILEPVLACDLLVLDDFAARAATDWIEDILAHIITTRYNQRRQMIITTNFCLEESQRPRREQAEEKQKTKRDLPFSILPDRVGIRVCSKLREMCRSVVINASDFRDHSSSKSLGERSNQRFISRSDT